MQQVTYYRVIQRKVDARSSQSGQAIKVSKGDALRVIGLTGQRATGADLRIEANQEIFSSPEFGKLGGPMPRAEADGTFLERLHPWEVIEHLSSLGISFEELKEKAKAEYEYKGKASTVEGLIKGLKEDPKEEELTQ